MSNDIRIRVAEVMGWKLIAKDSKNPPPISFRLCPICGYYGSRHNGREGMAPIEDGCPESHESQWVSAFDQWTIDGVECQDDPPPYTTSADAALTLCDQLKSEGWTVVIDNVISGKWCCEFSGVFNRHTQRYVATADSLPMALCLAFLKVREG